MSMQWRKAGPDEIACGPYLIERWAEIIKGTYTGRKFFAVWLVTTGRDGKKSKEILDTFIETAEAAKRAAELHHLKHKGAA